MASDRPRRITLGVATLKILAAWAAICAPIFFLIAYWALSFAIAGDQPLLPGVAVVHHALAKCIGSAAAGAVFLVIRAKAKAALKRLQRDA